MLHSTSRGFRPTMALISSTEYLILACVAVCTIAAFAYSNRLPSHSKYKLPPGPKGIPFFGNLLQVPVLRPYPQFRTWARKYGEIFYLRLGPQNVIVLNSADAADELFVNRSKNYSSRAPPHVAHDIMSDGQRMVFLPYDKEWKAARRSVQGAIGPGPSKKLRKIQEFESRVLLYDILCHGDKSITDPQIPGSNGEIPETHWFAVVRRYTTSVVMNVMYGNRIHRLFDNPYLHKIYDVLANFTHVGQPGNYPADAFPILRRLPDFLAPWRTEARKMHDWEMQLWGGLLNDDKDALRKGIARESFVNSYLRARADAGYEDAPGCGVTDDGWMRDKLLAYTAATVLEAGSDTTASAMQSFVLFMLSHPHVLRRAREEIDRAVGPDRMPGFEDEEQLPYLVACIKETLRRRAPTIMGIPHSADEDDVYKDYFIPKGSTVIGNVWAIHMDPDRYPNPTAFDPERFMTKDKVGKWASGPDCQDRDHYVFGWGRRYCQGSHIAEASLFIVLSRLLWGVDFRAPTDPKTGQPVIPDIADEEATWSDGFVSVPYIYPVSFRARSDKHTEMIRKSFEEVQAEWQVLGLAMDER